MVKDRLNPLNDYLFLKVMGEKGDEEQLRSFLNAVLGRQGQDALDSLEIIENKTIPAEIIGEKPRILEVRARTGRGERVNIEVQLRNLGNMDRRSLFYWSLEFSRGMTAGQDYRESPNVIAINIVNYEFLPEVPAFHTSFHIWEDTHREVLLTDALEIRFIDMVKFRRLAEKDIRNDPLHRWLTWFDRDSPPKLVEEVIKMDTAIQKAEEKMEYVSIDKEALRAYQMREMALSDWTSGLNHARREGIQEGMRKGIQKGMRKGIQKIAANLKRRGVPIDQIAEDTGLSVEDIARL
ncbi:MAG: Rpn family recombination-promoting nuclease/putative transposase [Spirochaetaceae bacterium]|jgi:predicted transposase/invertase (TIGR01784 family)|nr:Rpn family recombination-promoting nuclease/putative transposase [Spirochaetaceae bacterium]